MVYVDASVGLRGRIRCEVLQLSQDKNANTSLVSARGSIYLTSGGPSGDETGNCYVWWTGEVNSPKYDGSFTYISAPEVRSMLYGTFTIPHNADGTRSVTFTFNFGPTITQNFGSGGFFHGNFSPSLDFHAEMLK